MSNVEDERADSGGPATLAKELDADAEAVLGKNAGTSDALDGRTAGLTNQGGPEGGPVVSAEAGPEGGVNEVATGEAGASSRSKDRPR